MGSIHVINRQGEVLADRKQAAQKLNIQLADSVKKSECVVLGIPRGGIVIADGIARHYHARLDVVLTRKIRARHNSELAIGAVSEDGKLFKNEAIITALGLSDEYIEREKRHQLDVIEQRRKRYRSIVKKIPLQDKLVILTDDGIATGSTMQAAIWATLAESPQKIILALPIAPREALDRLAKDVDETICLIAPSDFRAISQFYSCFEQVDDEQVLEILKKYAGAEQP